jgi:colanic acid/amylovoran biosynthesis glycosyltransferase
LKCDVAKAGFERQIQFLGYRENIPEILRSAHIHVCPSICDDASPNVVLEAKKEGLPSVVFPVGGIPELIEHCVDGYICRNQTVEALIEAINYFMIDAEVRGAAGAAARQRLEAKFGEERFRREWTEVFLGTADD